MLASDLKKGDVFRIPGRRKDQKCTYVNLLEGEKVHPDHRGKLLVCDEKCRQMILDPNQEIGIKSITT